MQGYDPRATYATWENAKATLFQHTFFEKRTYESFSVPDNIQILGVWRTVVSICLKSTLTAISVSDSWEHQVDFLISRNASNKAETNIYKSTKEFQNALAARVEASASGSAFGFTG
jgi:hypothetical protein